MALLEKKLLVKRSTLAKAGKGLFTTVDIPKGTRIVEYKGKKRKWKDITEDPAFNGYVYYFNRHHVIDAKNTPQHLARYANDAKGLSSKDGLRNNSKYDEDGTKVYITSMKKIPAGSEIFVGYGKEYWDSVRENLAAK